MKTVSPLPSGDHEQRAHDDPADAEPVHQRGGERRGQPVEHHVDRDRGRDRASRPAELVVQRVDAARRARRGRPAAPTRARKVTAATHQAGWIRCVRGGARTVTPREHDGRPPRRASGRTGQHVQGSGHGAGRRPARGRRPRAARVDGLRARPARTSSSAAPRTPTAARSTACGWPRLDGGPVRTAAGYSVLPEHDASILRDGAAPSSSPGITGDLGDDRRHACPPELRRRCCAGRRGGARMVSICTGAFVLAAAGLLDGRPADHPLAARRRPSAGSSRRSTSTPTCSSSTTATC